MKTVKSNMQTTEVDNRDHNYSEFKSDKHQNNAKDMQNTHDDDVQILLPKSKPVPGKEIFGQVKDINELKKITPRVKLLAHDATRLTELTKLSLTKKVPIQNKHLLWDQTKQELKNYCRTCAGLKLPLVDIFSEKGVQMRLSQQIKHLEDINPYDSLSTQMCMDCICDLKMSYKFFMQIKKAEVRLKSLYHALSEAAARNIENIKTRSITDTSIEDAMDEHMRSSTSMSEEGASDSAGPKISAIYSLNNTPIKSEEPRKIMETSSPLETCDEIIGHISDDNESIEEFDPDDPPFQPDSSDAGESDDELDTCHHQSQKARIQKKERLKAISQPGFSSSTIEQKSDVNLQTTINDSGNTHVSPQKTVPKSEPALSSGTAKEFPKQPNILKRRLLMPPPRTEQTDQVNDKVSPTNISDKNIGPREFKVQKLDMNNLLSIDNGPEDGIMYVTVKGTKPNELLLVKVKKMDKPAEKKDEKCFAKKSVEKKEKDIFVEKIKPDTRDQIIEEQIEEYKKKREKVLGGHTGSNFSLTLEENQPRYLKANDSSSKSMSSVDSINLESGAEDTAITQSNDDLAAEDTAEEKPPSEKLHDNTSECISRLAKLKVKWEEAKRKKESLQRELDESYTEGNIEKLARILGEKEKNLQDFQDYLKQRRIVITRLKDEDIISLYEDRNNALLRNSLPDLIDETQPADYIPEEHYLECDYCPQTFASKEILEEHLKTHDYKIMHYCEDCSEVFSTNKAKRNHNIVCIKKLICKYCDLMLDSKGKKRQHEQKHCDSMFGQLCDVCGEKFKHQGTLDQHIKMQHMSWEKIFQCPKCPKKFAFKQKLSFHLKSVHTTLRAYLCEDCGADFKNPASLRHHRIRKHQPVGNKRECPVCHKLVPFYSLSKHMHTHKAYTIQCPHCDKMFKNSSTLKQHVRIHEDQRQYRCDTCGVGFNRRDGLRLHMRVHEKTDSRGLKECSCQVCGEKFPNHSTLVIHRNRVHKDGRQYTCHICNRSMISTRSLEWHMSHIHNESLPGIVKDEADGAPEKKRVSCYHCNKTFKTEMILRTHIKNTHMEKDPMKCLDCELTFTSEVRLRHHMMVNHNRLEGTLACPHCPKRFVNQLRLKTHMISHSEERPYTCEICGFNLKTKIQLIKHHQNRHSDERPLQCRYCPWRCKQVSALVCHERTHTNERPYSCSVCRQRFKYLGDKNKHERRHESLGGSGFKRIVPGRNIKPKVQEETSGSEQENEGLASVDTQLTEEQYEERESQEFEEQIVKFEPQEIVGEYEQEYEETSREASDAAEVIMNMEDTTVYTEEVTADNIESAEIMADEMMTNEILQSGTVVHLQQEDDSGKIQVIPVMLSLPDLSDANTEVNLATASIMYNN